jgi:hypothetical protein
MDFQLSLIRMIRRVKNEVVEHGTVEGSYVRAKALQAKVSDIVVVVVIILGDELLSHAVATFKTTAP